MSNARQQQAILLLRLLLGLGLAAWAQPRWGWGVAIGFAWLGLFGWVLAILPVFLVLRGWPRPAGIARPTLAQCLRAAFVEWWAYECVFSWQQPFAELVLPDVVGRPGQRGVLLLHGFRCNRGLWHRWVRCLNEQGVPHRSLSLSPPFASIDDYASQIDAAVQGLWQETGLAPVVVAHSMGGLALRAWRRATAAAPERIHHVYTLGTPHAGTLMAQLSGAPNARQMRVDSAWLQSLAASEAAVWRQRFTCFVSACDQVVCPSTRATLPDAEWISVPATGHLQLVHEPLVIETVMARLQAEPTR